MLDLNTSLLYYKRKEIQEAILYAAKDREIAVRYNDFFGKRPDILQYPSDILDFAKKGATSFHSSEERWENPLLLSSNSSKKELEDLRVGWDLILDIDCAFLEYSKISAYYVINALKREGIKKISCKFSGNKGFHIGIAFEAFPKKMNKEDVNILFPDAPRKIAEYIKHKIKEPVAKKIQKEEGNDFSKIIEKTNLKKEEITYSEKNEYGEEVLKLNVEPFLNIDTILISSRHLFRMPYSLHEKSGLASIPIDPNKIMEFKKTDADPKTLKISDFVFLQRENNIQNEANNLFINSFDFAAKNTFEKEFKEKKEKEINTKDKEFESIQTQVSQDLFPECIKQILKGLKDGRKRAVLILINFLSSVGWTHETIEEKLKEWNKLNPEPLKENYIIGQLRYHKQQKKKVLPPNCENNMYYKDLGVKCENCKEKNPVSFVRKKLWHLNRIAEEKEIEESNKQASKSKKNKEKSQLKDKDKQS